MEIDVEGRTWTVEQRSVRTLAPQPGEGYCALRYRPRDGASGEGVEMAWIPRPRRLTRGLAGRLLLLAGERLWRDPRSGVLHRVLMEGGSWPGDEAPAPAAGATTVRFLSADGSVSTAYDLARPLALAQEAELVGLLDRAAAERPPRARTAVMG